MIFRAFAIHDIRADVFNPPFFVRTVGEAMRSFTELANDPQSFVSKYPQDYRLVVVGSFNDERGDLVAEPVTSLGFASDVKRRPEVEAPPALRLSDG